jgi:hypothetical protein
MFIGVVSAPLWNTETAKFAGTLFLLHLPIAQPADPQACSPSRTSSTSSNTTTTPHHGKALLPMSKDFA